jgi:hypothetical protein
MSAPLLPEPQALDRRPPSDPERTFVIFMCVYAGDILSGVLPGPYSDEDARRYARACLVPSELLERTELDVELAARALRLPADELHAARDELAPRALIEGGRRTPPVATRP